MKSAAAVAIALLMVGILVATSTSALADTPPRKNIGDPGQCGDRCHGINGPLVR